MIEKTFSEKESLELISKMIQQTKQNLEVRNGNVLLYYGYTAVAISVVVYGLCKMTSEVYWHYLWLLMFIPMMVERIAQKKHKAAVVTYTDQAVKDIWVVINLLIILSLLTMLSIGFFLHPIPLILMLPLSLLFVGIGTAFTGIITKEKSMTFFPLISTIFGIYMLVNLSIGQYATLEWNLWGGASFFTMLVLPGHILNRKSKLSCLKN